MYLEEIKILIGIGDSEQDELLETIIDMTKKRLLSLTQEKTVPDSLDYIVTEVSIARFNRIGNEGMESYSQEGQSLKFLDSDFGPFKNDIEAYLDDETPSLREKGQVFFY